MGLYAGYTTPVLVVMHMLFYTEPQSYVGVYSRIDGHVETCRKAKIWSKTDTEQTAQHKRRKGNNTVEMVTFNSKVEYGQHY
eukprot:14987079-Ditylum_brightwellii.AAC.1